MTERDPSGLAPGSHSTVPPENIDPYVELSTSGSVTADVVMVDTQPGILRLPVELQTEVVEYITGIADLKSLCLTCKELQYVATPVLYHDVTLSIQQLALLDYTDTFHEDSTGLRHVRSLQLLDNAGGPGGQKYRHDVHGDAICHVLQMLPNDCLTRFEFDTFQNWSMDIVFILRTQQRRLANYQWHRLLHRSSAVIRPCEADMRLITSIQLYIRYAEDCEEANQLLRYAQNLTHLEVCAVAGKTLRLFAYTERRSAVLTRSRKPLRKTEVQELANQIFDVLSDTCPNLIALVVDARTLSAHQDCTTRNVQRSGYMRARQVDVCGRIKVVGVPIEPHMIKHHEPCSEIFDDDFGPVR